VHSRASLASQSDVNRDGDAGGTEAQLIAIKSVIVLTNGHARTIGQNTAAHGSIYN